MFRRISAAQRDALLEVMAMATEGKIQEVIQACRDYGRSSIIALAGPPATGKSHVALIAAQRFAGEPTRVKEVQFHQAFTYEEFIEGLRIDATGAVRERPGVFMDWNETALADPDHDYVLLIEELTRANLAAVLGELLTYIEHRERSFDALFSRAPIRVAPRLTILATFNPVDRSALNIDDALLRRLRIIDFLPDAGQLQEMLSAKTPPFPPHVIAKISNIFEACKQSHGEDYATLVPFGHGIFRELASEADLHALWHQRIRRMLYRPLQDPHPFATTIEQSYPWKDRTYRVPAPPPEVTTLDEAATPAAYAGEAKPAG